MSEGSGTDTSHLYDGKSQDRLPQQKKAAGRVTQSTSYQGMPSETKIPTGWNHFWRPSCSLCRFLSPNKTVVRLQMASVTTLILLGLVIRHNAFLGTVWFGSPFVYLSSVDSFTISI